MTEISIPQFIVATIGLSVVAFCILAWILWLQLPSLGAIIKKYARLTWARIRMNKQTPIVDPARQERTARNLDGDILRFD